MQRPAISYNLRHLSKNKDSPFWIKTLCDAALLSAILYGCESWMCPNIGRVSTIYMAAVKLLLGFRKTRPNDLCLLELAYPSVNAMVRNIQQRSIQRLMAERRHMVDDPFNMIWTLVADSRTPATRYVMDLLQESDILANHCTSIKVGVRTRKGSTDNTYSDIINPILDVYQVYTHKLTAVSEYERLSFTRMRLSAHNLAIETGRWGRKPRERQRIHT